VAIVLEVLVTIAKTYALNEDEICSNFGKNVIYAEV